MNALFYRPSPFTLVPYTGRDSVSLSQTQQTSPHQLNSADHPAARTRHEEGRKTAVTVNDREEEDGERDDEKDAEREMGSGKKLKRSS